MDNKVAKIKVRLTQLEKNRPKIGKAQTGRKAKVGPGENPGKMALKALKR
jgi:hypothetical protein